MTNKAHSTSANGQSNARANQVGFSSTSPGMCFCQLIAAMKRRKSGEAVVADPVPRDIDNIPDWVLGGG